MIVESQFHPGWMYDSDQGQWVSYNHDWDATSKVVPLDQQGTLQFKCVVTLPSMDFTSTQETLAQAVDVAEQFVADLKESE